MDYCPPSKAGTKRTAPMLLPQKAQKRIKQPGGTSHVDLRLESPRSLPNFVHGEGEPSAANKSKADPVLVLSEDSCAASLLKCERKGIKVEGSGKSFLSAGPDVTYENLALQLKTLADQKTRLINLADRRFSHTGCLCPFIPAAVILVQSCTRWLVKNLLGQ
jgi:hypothetical protein